MARKKKNKGGGSGGKSGGGSNAAAAASSTVVSSPPPLSDESAIAKDVVLNEDAERAIEAAAAGTVCPSASADSASPTAGGVSSSFQAGLANALRGIKKAAGLGDIQDQSATDGAANSGGVDMDTSSALSNNPKSDKSRFSKPLTNDALKEMVDQAVANPDGDEDEDEDEDEPTPSDAKAKAIIDPPPPQRSGKKRDATGGWKVTKTVAGGKTHLALSAPLKPPAPDAAADSEPDFNEKLAMDTDVDADIDRADRVKPQMSASGQPKSILKNKMAATAVKTSALSNNDGGIDADAVSDDGVIDIDRENDDFDDEEVDSDGVVGVCLHCSRPRTKSKQIKTKSPNDVDVDELVEDALDLSDPTALDSSKRPRAVQVSCDDCHSYICTACHWCHEYQANHEIRVCDRCDAFYCRGCDEMDQCEDCSEVVCGGCSTLMSCKFCGCGLCEDCATACGRCGIVLCSRDAKFAVECDTCRMSYCLVCLASGTKDPCVRCGHRPSKRVEQLVHLRLKSIYKAFKQSGASLGPSKSGDKDLPALEDDFDGKNKSGKAAAAAALARAAGMANLPSGNKGGKGGGNDDFGPDALAGDVGAVLQAAAAAAAAGDKSNRRSGHGSHDFGGEDTANDDISASASANRRGSALKPSISDQFAARTEEEADAAAAALLAELDLDDAKAAANAGKKSKKKKKKERERAEKAATEAKAAEEEAEVAAAASEAGKSKKKKKKKKGKTNAPEPSLPLPTPKPKKERAISMDDASDASSDEEDLLMLVGGGGGGSKQAGKKGPGGKGSASTPVDSAGQSKTSTPATSNQPSPKGSPLLKAKDQKSKISSSGGPVKDDDADDLSLLTEFVQTRDVAAIEALMESLKGVPGKAAIRKNAKKALKKLKEELGPSYSAPSFAPPPPKKKEQEWVENKATSKSKSKTKKDEPNPSAVANDTPDTVADADQYRPPEPLLKLVSQTHRTVKDETGKGTDHSTPRTETVLHMSPLVVGWVIGRGGTRIRDLMEDSGAKIWIDQDSMGPKEARVVYISGPRKSVDSAVRSMKDLVAKAPVGGGSGMQPSSPTSSAKSGASSVPEKPLTPAAPTPTPMTPTNAAAVSQTAATPVAPATPAVPAAAPPTSFAKAAAAGAPASVPAPPIAGATAPLTSVPTPPIVPPTASAAVSTSAVQTISTSTSKNGVHSHSLTCEPRFVPLLIGRRGWTVKHIQDATGARVDIDQTVSPRKIDVSSSDEAAVKSAVRMVRDVLNYPHAVEGDQKEKEKAIDGAAAELAAKIQAQAQAQAMAALLAQQQQLAAGQPLAASQPQAASFLSADAQPAGIPNTKTPLFPQHVARSATAGTSVPSYANSNGAMQYQDHRPPPQSQLDQHLSVGPDGGIASIQQSMTHLQLQAAQQKLQQQQLLLEQQRRLLEQQARNSTLPPGIGGGVPPQGSLGLNPTRSAAMATGADAIARVSGDTGLGLMANATAPEFSANAPAFQARSEPSSSGVASLSSSYHAASTANSANVAQGSIFGGLSGSALLAGGSIPTQQQQQSTGQQHDALGAALGGTGAPTTASERDIIDDIFGSMGAGMAGGADAIAGLGGGVSDWGATGLSGWGAGVSNGDTPQEGQQPPSGGTSSTGASLQSLIGGFVGAQQQQQQQQQQNNWNA